MPTFINKSGVELEVNSTSVAAAKAAGWEEKAPAKKASKKAPAKKAE